MTNNDHKRIIWPLVIGYWIDVLAKSGERISLVENDRLTVNLRIVTLPESR